MTFLLFILFDIFFDELSLELISPLALGMDGFKSVPETLPPKRLAFLCIFIKLLASLTLRELLFASDFDYALSWSIITSLVFFKIWFRFCLTSASILFSLAVDRRLYMFELTWFLTLNLFGIFSLDPFILLVVLRSFKNF